MKKLFLLSALLFVTSICAAQTTIWIKNNSGVTLDIGGIHAIDDGTCSPPSPNTFGAFSIPHGGFVSFVIPASREVFRIGAMESGGGASGWIEGSNPCWSSGTCASTGSFTFNWFGCNAITIDP